MQHVTFASQFILWRLGDPIFGTDVRLQYDLIHVVAGWWLILLEAALCSPSKMLLQLVVPATDTYSVNHGQLWILNDDASSHNRCRISRFFRNTDQHDGGQTADLIHVARMYVHSYLRASVVASDSSYVRVDSIDAHGRQDSDMSCRQYTWNDWSLW